MLRRALDVYYGLAGVVREGAKFLTVGGMAYLVDVGGYNLLVYGGGAGPLYDRPLTAKATSVVLATLLAYTGNRTWTFRHRYRRGVPRELVLFVVLNAVAMGIALACLATSRYVLGLAGPLADNLSANVIGLALGTGFRFWSYRRWVFPEKRAHAVQSGV